MHRTESIDYGIVLEGEITLVLDDSEVTLHAGDVVVQRGTDHAWANRSDAVTQVAFILVDGAFTPEDEPSGLPTWIPVTVIVALAGAAGGAVWWRRRTGPA